jgi:transposase-like protein
MTSFLAAESYERTPGRRGYRNGYTQRLLKTRVGELELLVPKDRDGEFQTELFERYQRSEKALVLRTFTNSLPEDGAFVCEEALHFFVPAPCLEKN